MNKNKIKILIADDEEIIRLSLLDDLKDEGFEVECAVNGEEALNKLSGNNFNFLILDYKMPIFNGLQVLEKIKKSYLSIKCIMMTAFGNIENAVKAMKLGAIDYISKPFSIDELLKIIENNIENNEEERNPKKLFSNGYKSNLSSAKAMGQLIGGSATMQKIYDLIKVVAKTSAPVVIYGESGTEKELVAKEIHLSSERKNNIFVQLSCKTFSENLLERELFGSEKGVLAQNFKKKSGKIETTDKGTLFLDDIHCMPLSVQIKLLKFLQHKEFQRLGGGEILKSDVRIIAASNIDLRKKIAEGSFYEDLYYKLNVVSINLPALRNRREDIPMLIDYFVKKYSEKYNKNISRVSFDYYQTLYLYSYPDNVRELEHLVEKSVVLCEKEEIDINCLDKELLLINPEPVVSSAGEKNLKQSLKVLEKEYVKKILEESGGKKSTAAKKLGIHRKTLWEKIKKYEI